MPDWYNYRSETWSFRDRDGLTIPKSCREGAYQLSVDIIIETISHEKYVSDYTYPIKSHYGFAVLTFQDCLSLEIPIHQPRQRLYEGRVEEAFSMWAALQQWSKADCAWYKELFLAINNGSVEEYPLIAYDDIQWNELPLREVFIKPIEHTQYKLQVLWTEPKFFTDCTGILRNGKSKMPDSEHDNGIPSNGIQPNQLPSNAPFDPTLPFTSNGGTPWLNNTGSLGSANSINPSNIGSLDTPGLIWWVELVTVAKAASLPYGCAKARKTTATYPVPTGTAIAGYRPSDPLADNGCGGQNTGVQLYDYSGAAIAGVPNPSYTVGLEVSYEVKTGTTYTAINTVEYI